MDISIPLYSKKSSMSHKGPQDQNSAMVIIPQRYKLCGRTATSMLVLQQYMREDHHREAFIPKDILTGTAR